MHLVRKEKVPANLNVYFNAHINGWKKVCGQRKASLAGQPCVTLIITQ